MNIRNFVIIALVLLCSPLLRAQYMTTKEDALQVAVGYMNAYITPDHACSAEQLTLYATKNMDGHSLLHELHFGRHKLLVSGVMSCKPVVMYQEGDSENLLLNDNDVSGISYFISRYCKEIQFAIDSSKHKDTILEEWKLLLKGDMQTPKNPTDIGPLLTSSWGQSISNDRLDTHSYNYYINIEHNTCDLNRYCPTGCVATAVGQIMNYWKHPVYRANSTIQFDWCNMADKLNVNFNNQYLAQRNAVARLLSEIGLASGMRYCVLNGCGSFAMPDDAKDALVNDFGYSDDADLRWRQWNSDSSWKEMLVNELVEGRPVFYSALADIEHISDAGGHAFVIHGYKATTREFRINFGNYCNETLTTIDRIGLDDAVDFTNMENAIFYLHPENHQNYCNITLPLLLHYASYYLNNQSPAAYLNVPTCATTLISSDVSYNADWRTIPPGATSNYVAHREIILQDGFHAERGCEFHAYIEPCEACENQTNTQQAPPQGYQPDVEQDEPETMIAMADSTLWRGLESDEPSELHLYPNPTSGEVQIECGELSISTVELLDLQGRVLERQEPRYPQYSTLNLQPYPTGTYIVRITTTEGTFTRRVTRK